jgi:DNA-binding IclR family transcriptional regulator
MTQDPDRSRRGAEHGDSQRGLLGTVRNATLLLDLLSQGERFQSLTALAEASGLAVTTTHRVLRSLAHAELVSQHPQSARYSLGPGLLRLAESFRARLPVLQQLAPYLVEMRDNTKATIEVTLLVQGLVVVADRVTGENVTRVFRDSNSLHVPMETAAGRVLLAHADDATWNEVVAYPGATHVPSEAERRRWAAASHMVHTLDDTGELQVAVPVHNRQGRVVAALAATSRLPFPGDDSQRLEEHCARQLQRAAAAIRDSLGDA